MHNSQFQVASTDHHKGGLIGRGEIISSTRELIGRGN